jgi:hypothetical protein
VELTPVTIDAPTVVALPNGVTSRVEAGTVPCHLSLLLALCRTKE